MNAVKKREDDYEAIIESAREALEQLEGTGNPVVPVFTALFHYSRAQAASMAATQERIRATDERLAALEARLLKTREERPEDDHDLAPTPAMKEAAMLLNARNGRIARAAKRSGFTKAEWLAWCEKHDHNPEFSIKTERRGHDRDERQTQLNLTASRTKRSRPKPKKTKRKAKKRRGDG